MLSVDPELCAHLYLNCIFDVTYCVVGTGSIHQNCVCTIKTGAIVVMQKEH